MRFARGLVACVAALHLLAGTAAAGWTLATPLPPLEDIEFATGAAPGAVAVLGVSGNSEIVTAAHAPGGPWGAATSVATGDNAITGPGGAFALRTNSQALLIGRVGADGAPVTPLARLTTSTLDPVAVAIAPDGTIGLLVSGSADDLRAYVVAPGATGATLVGTLTAQLVAEASLATTGGGAFMAVWVREPDFDPPSVVARGFTASSVSAPAQTLSTSTASDVSVSEPRVAVSDGNAVAAWVEQRGALGGAFARARAVTRFDAGRAPATLAGASAVQSISLAAGAGGRFLLAYDGDGSSPTAGGSAILDDLGQVACATPDGYDVSVAAARGTAFALLGHQSGASVEARTVAPGTGVCSQGDANASPPLIEPDRLAAAADAEGTLAAVAAAGTASAVAALDDVPPSVRRTAVPRQVRTGEPFDVSVGAADAWGIAGIAWTVDGQAAGEGASIRIAGQSEGRHEVAVTIRDAAGGATSRTATVEAGSTASPTPVLPPVVIPVAPVTPGTTDAGPRPRVLSARLERRGGVWFVRLRLRGASRVRLTLLRSPYLSGERLRELGRAPTCSGRSPHGPTGTRRRAIRTLPGGVVRLRLPSGFQRALRLRARYILRIVALADDGRRSKAALRRRTIC